MLSLVHDIEFKEGSPKHKVPPLGIWGELDVRYLPPTW